MIEPISNLCLYFVYKKYFNFHIHINLSLNFKQILDDDEPIKDLVEYKIMIKTSINNILIKLENDAEYRQSLEDDLENLEIEYNKKCFEVDRISNEAQEAINDCKNEADEMSEAMM